MASVTLKGAQTFYHEGIKFIEGKEKIVTDAVAKALSEFEAYFPLNLIKFGGKEPVQPVAAPAKTVKTVTKTTAPKPPADASDEPGVEV